MTQLRHRACDHHPELRVSGQEPAAEQAGEHDLTHIHQDDEQRCPAAEVPQKIRQAGVSAAFFADVVVHAGVRHDDSAIAAAEQVRCATSPCSVLLIALLADGQPDGRSLQTEDTAELILQIALVGEVEQARVVAEDDKVRRLHADLRHIIDLQAASLVRGRLRPQECC